MKLYSLVRAAIQMSFSGVGGAVEGGMAGFWIGVESAVGEALMIGGARSGPCGCMDGTPGKHDPLFLTTGNAQIKFSLHCS